MGRSLHWKVDCIGEMFGVEAQSECGGHKGEGLGGHGGEVHIHWGVQAEWS